MKKSLRIVPLSPSFLTHGLLLVLFINMTTLVALENSATIESDYLPLTDDSIRQAVALYTSGVEGERGIAEEFYGPIELWNTTLVKDMSRLFRNKLNFNEDIRKWDTRQVTSMQLMFYGAAAFSYDLSAWNISSAVNLGGMFVYASSYAHSLCWTMLSEFVFVEDMFCGANGGSLDPCCVQEELVMSACCGDTCTAFCFQTSLEMPTATGTPSGLATGPPTVRPSQELTNTPTSVPTTPEPSQSPMGALTSIPSLPPTKNPTTHSPSTFPSNVTPSVASSNVTMPPISISIRPTHFLNGHGDGGVYSNDDPLDIPYKEPLPQVTSSLQQDVTDQGLEDNYGQDNKSNKLGWIIGSILGVLVGVAVIALLVAVRRHHKEKRRQAFSMRGKDYDEGVEAQLDEHSCNGHTLILEGPPDDKDLVDFPRPKFEDISIVIEQRVTPRGDEAVELSFDDGFQEYEDEIFPGQDKYMRLDDSAEEQPDSEVGNILTLVRLEEVRVLDTMKD